MCRPTMTSPLCDLSTSSLHDTGFSRKSTPGLPKNENLLTATRAIIAALPDDDRSCAICLTTREDETTTSIIDNLSNTEPWISFTFRTIEIQPGFETIPIRMPCGHVFCSGCIKAWLDKEGALECPMRDMSYGIHRSRALLELEVAIYKTM